MIKYISVELNKIIENHNIQCLKTTTEYRFMLLGFRLDTQNTKQ